MKNRAYLTLLAFVLIINPETHAQCNAPSAKTIISANNVSFSVLNGGDMSWDLVSSPHYEIPKGSGINALFSSSIWFGGRQQSELRVAGNRYRASGTDFFPGPIDANGNLLDSDCSLWDRIYVVEKADIDAFLQGNPASQAIKEWPGKSKPSDPDLAPFQDANGDGVYNYNDGDYPLIHGDVCFWYVINDIGGPHGETAGNPMGIEIQVMGYVYSDPSSPLNNTTFYDYKISNKSSHDISKSYIGFFVDGDLGNSLDDYVASHSDKEMGIFYNGDALDEDANGRLGYGVNPPALGLKLLSTPKNAANQEIGMSNFIVFSNGGGGNPHTKSPTNDVEYYNYMRSFWLDGAKMTFGGNGYFSSTHEEYDYMFDLAADSTWSECSEQNAPGDRRFVMSSGPFSLKAGTSVRVNSAFIWARDLNRTMSCDSLDTLFGAADYVQSFFDSTYTVPTGITQVEKNVRVNIYPNPSKGVINIERPNATEGKVYIYDLSGGLQKELTTNQKFTQVRDLMPGTYFIKVTEVENTIIKKVMVTN